MPSPVVNSSRNPPSWHSFPKYRDVNLLLWTISPEIFAITRLLIKILAMYKHYNRCALCGYIAGIGQFWIQRLKLCRTPTHNPTSPILQFGGIVLWWSVRCSFAFPGGKFFLSFCAPAWNQKKMRGSSGWTPYHSLERQTKDPLCFQQKQHTHSRLDDPE